MWHFTQNSFNTFLDVLSARRGPRIKVFFFMIWLTIVWSLWKPHNNIVFSRKSVTVKDG